MSFVMTDMGGFRTARRFAALVAAGSMLTGAGLVAGAVPAHADGETLSISDVTVLEGQAGKTTTARFTVTLSAPRSTATKVTYSTADGSATAGADYTAKSGTASIGIGKTSVTVSVVVAGDDDPEPSEDFSVNLVSVLTPTVSIADGVGLGTVIDNDATNPPALTIGDTIFYEGNSGTQAAVFAVGLSAPVLTDTLVPYHTQDSSAVAPGDYKAKSGVVTIKAGKTSARISVTTYGNTVADGSRAFFVMLDPTTVPILDGGGIGTILDDEGSAPGVSIGDTWFTEGDTGTIVASNMVTLSSPAPADVAISYVIAGTNATGGLDFKAKSGTLTIRAGKTSGKISVTVNGDTLDEGPTFETVEVTLIGTGASGIDVVDGVGTANIEDDDFPPDPEPGVSWSTTAQQYPGPTGSQFVIACPSGGEANSIWGTTIYTDDSSICTAAVHMGLITLASGGEVTIEILDGQASYQGTEANGVTSNSWGSWARSFQFFVGGDF
jgi:hypothetical protein